MFLSIQGNILTYFNLGFFILFFRQLSLSSSNLTLDSKPIEPPTQTSQFTANLLKNDSSHPGDASENSQQLENVNSNRAICVQKKRRSALESSRVGMAPGRVIASFPEGPVNAVMRKAQSVHDLVHEGKDTRWNDGMSLRMKRGHLSGGLKLSLSFYILSYRLYMSSTPGLSRENIFNIIN